MSKPLQPHPDAERLDRAFERLYAAGTWAPWDDDLFRFAHPKYAGESDFMSGLGAKLKGGRWTPPGGPPTLYASSHPELACKETFAVADRFAIRPRDLTPRIIKAIEVNLHRVIDLRTGSIRTSIGVSRERMVECNWEADNTNGSIALTQAIGQAAAKAGFEGLIVPSAVATEHENLAIFVQNLRKGSSIAVVDGTDA